MEQTIRLDDLYASLRGVIRPPSASGFAWSEQPLILDGVREACYWIARLFGWEIRGSIPDHIDKAVVILAPHTSELDFFVAMAAYRRFRDIRVAYLAKKELFSGPFAWMFSKTGGIPVDRSGSHDVVNQAANQIRASDRFFLTLAPEGTRSRTDRWKSGFYRIAVEADVPIIMGYLDYGRREAGLGDILYPTGDYEADARKIEAFYRDKTAFHPARWNPRVV